MNWWYTVQKTVCRWFGGVHKTEQAARLSQQAVGYEARLAELRLEIHNMRNRHCSLCRLVRSYWP